MKLHELERMNALLITFIFFTAFSVNAQEIDGQVELQTREISPREDIGRRLRLQDVLERALENDARLKQALERLLKREAQYQGSESQFFPKLTAETSQAFATGDRHWLSYFDLSIEEPFFQGGKVLAEKNGLKLKFEEERLRLTETKLDLKQAIQILYVEILNQKELVRFSEEETKELRKTYRAFQNLFETEIIPHHELIRVETLLKKANFTLIEHKETYHYLFSILKEAIGIKETEALELEPFTQLPKLKNSLSFYLARVRKHDPIYRLCELEVKEKGFEKKVLQAERFPHVSLVARWNFHRDIFVDTDRAILGAVGKWNIWDFGRLSSEIKAKTHEMEETRWQALGLVREKENEVRRLFHGARVLKEKIKLIEAGQREREELYKNEKAKLITGERGRRELLASFLKLQSVKRKRLETVTEYRVLVLKLERNAGLMGFREEGR